MTNKNELTLNEAKANFISSVTAADPIRVLRNRPLQTVGIALCTGILVGFSGKKLSKAVAPGSKFIADILKKLL